MKKYLLFLGVLITSTQLSFGQLVAKVYEDPNLESIVKNHKKIAILPMHVTVQDVKANKKNRMTEEEKKEMEDAYQEAFQSSMYSWFLKMKQKGKMGVDIQDVHQTNALLKKNGINDVNELATYTHDEISKMLGVDAVFGGKVITTRTMSQGGALAVAVVFGVGMKTGDADVSVYLYNGPDGKMIWNFDRTVASSYASTPEDVVEYLMKRVSKRFPYKD